MRVLNDADGVAAATAELVAASLADGARTLVLAGGTTPQRAYQLLAAQHDLPWGRVGVFFGDERCVGPDDPDSNFRAVREALLDRVFPLSVHRIPGELGAEEAAREYEEVLRSAGPLDLVLLGLGEDGHTASLFPDNPALAAGGLVTAVHQAPKPPPDRVSLTLGALNGARRVVMVATGEGKRQALAKVAAGTVPAARIERAEWIVDRAAAGG